MRRDLAFETPSWMDELEYLRAYPEHKGLLELPRLH